MFAKGERRPKAKGKGKAAVVASDDEDDVDAEEADEVKPPTKAKRKAPAAKVKAPPKAKKAAKVASSSSSDSDDPPRKRGRPPKPAAVVVEPEPLDESSFDAGEIWQPALEDGSGDQAIYDEPPHQRPLQTPTAALRTLALNSSPPSPSKRRPSADAAMDISPKKRRLPALDLDPTPPRASTQRTVIELSD